MTQVVTTFTCKCKATGHSFLLLNEYDAKQWLEDYRSLGASVKKREITVIETKL